MTTSPPVPREPIDRVSWPVLIPLLLGILTGSLATSMINTALPRLATDLGLSETARPWVVNGYPLALAAAIVPAARFGDRIGRRTGFIIGMAGFALLSALAPALPGPGLLATRFALGITGALIIANVVATIGAVFTGHARTVANGLWMAVFGSATAIGPLAGGLLTDRWGWTWVFWICVPLAAAGAVLAGRTVPQTRAATAPPWHPGWALVGALGLGALVYAVQQLPASPLLGLLVGPVGAVVLVVFLRRQRTLPDALVEVSLFADRRFTAAFAAIMVSGGAAAGATFLSSLYLQQELGRSASAAGALLLWQAVATTAGGLVAPWVARFDPRGRAMAYALLLQGAGLVWAALDDARIGPALFCIGAGFGIVGTLATTALFGSAPRESVSQVGVVQEIGFALGSGVGIAVLAAIAAAAGFSGALLVAAGAGAATAGLIRFRR